MATFGDFHNVTGAGWSVYWRIPQQVGGGMEVWWADFHGRRVMWKGSQPLAIVPYHTPVPAGEPPGPEFCYKDGLGPECGGAAFTALKSSAPNADLRGQPGWHAAVDTEAVDVHVEPASSFDPRALVITAKFQCGWYQYVQRWEFDGYGEIHPHLGMGGALNPSAKDKAHVHHMYFRIDLDIDGFSTDVFEVFRHVSFDDTAGGDQWTVESSQGKHLVDPKSSRKFRIRDLVSAVGPGHPTRGYEIEIPSLGGTDAHSTADIWATVYRGDSVETGEDVGPPNCGDAVIDKYATGPLDTVNGSDVVAWIVVRHHHEARETTEEANFLPYHYEGFEIMPRGFEVFERPRQPREPRPPGRAARRR
jgi:hypothetical protein